MLVYGVGDDFVVGNLLVRGQSTSKRFEPPSDVGRETSSNNHSNPSFGTFLVVCSELWKSIGKFLKICMHGAHDDTVFKGGVSDFEWGEEVGVFGVHGGSRWF